MGNESRLPTLASIVDWALRVPRRAAWLWLGLAIFLATGGYRELADAATATLKLIGDRHIDELPTWNEGIAIVKMWLFSALHIGFCLCATALHAFLHHRYIVCDVVPLSRSHRADREAYLAGAVESCGITRVYSSIPNVSIANQDYADAARAIVSGSKHVKLLSIAGFEYIGRGNDSLLLDLLHDKRRLETLDVILLDPVLGGAAITNRVRTLAKKDKTYTDERMRQHIQSTLDTVSELAKQRNGIGLYQIPEHPGFRMLLGDKELLVSAYRADSHGHEAPMFRIKKEGSGSWYEAFSAYFQRLKDSAKKVI